MVGYNSDDESHSNHRSTTSALPPLCFGVPCLPMKRPSRRARKVPKESSKSETHETSPACSRTFWTFRSTQPSTLSYPTTDSTSQVQYRILLLDFVVLKSEANS
ncbi:hypothetical protein FH972_015402 [Carpinus fangiana]|uniref:Uncharacterized protein n=1 Tax=Carpinus fangiana TaxID=176857 RepID=A0A5N6RCL6_9ROSI|nr:hypothetical protein FH972_015402 [Carpinus fangiana]